MQFGQFKYFLNACYNKIVYEYVYKFSYMNLNLSTWFLPIHEVCKQVQSAPIKLIHIFILLTFLKYVHTSKFI